MPRRALLSTALVWWCSCVFDICVRVDFVTGRARGGCVRGWSESGGVVRCYILKGRHERVHFVTGRARGLSLIHI